MLFLGTTNEKKHGSEQNNYFSTSGSCTKSRKKMLKYLNNIKIMKNSVRNYKKAIFQGIDNIV